MANTRELERAVERGAGDEADIEFRDLWEDWAPEEDIELRVRAGELASLVREKYYSRRTMEYLAKLPQDEQTKQRAQTAKEGYERARRLQNLLIKQFGQQIVDMAREIIREQDEANRKGWREALHE